MPVATGVVNSFVGPTLGALLPLSAELADPRQFAHCQIVTPSAFAEGIAPAIANTPTVAAISVFLSTVIILSLELCTTLTEALPRSFGQATNFGQIEVRQLHDLC